MITEPCTKERIIAKLEQLVKSAHLRIDGVEKKQEALENKINFVENTTIRLEALLTRLESSVNRIAHSIDKAKWLLLTGVCLPIIVAILIALLTK